MSAKRLRKGDALAVGPEPDGSKYRPGEKIGTFAEQPDGTIEVTVLKVPMFGQMLLRPKGVRKPRVVARAPGLTV